MKMIILSMHANKEHPNKVRNFRAPIPTEKKDEIYKFTPCFIKKVIIFFFVIIILFYISL